MSIIVLHIAILFDEILNVMKTIFLLVKSHSTTFFQYVSAKYD